MTTDEILQAIQNGEVDDGLDAISRMARERQTFAAKRVAAQAKVGDRIRLTNIRPKVLDGATGTVRNRRQSSLMIEIDKEFALGAGRFAWQIERGSPVGVPAACIGEIL